MGNDIIKATQRHNEDTAGKRQSESKNGLSRLERWGILAGIITGIAAAAISIASLMQTQATQHEADQQRQAAQADLVVTELYPAGNEAKVMVQNFSSLPIYRLSISGRDEDDLVGTLPPCSQIDITRIAQPSGTDLLWSDGIPPVGLEFTDATGLVWSRLGADAPHRGKLSDAETAKITEGSKMSGGEFGLEPSTPIQSCP